MTRELYKHKIIIWAPYDTMDLESLAFEATEGHAYCSMLEIELISKPNEDPDWDDNEFFDQETT